QPVRAERCVSVDWVGGSNASTIIVHQLTSHRIVGVSFVSDCHRKERGHITGICRRVRPYHDALLPVEGERELPELLFASSHNVRMAADVGDALIGSTWR